MAEQLTKLRPDRDLQCYFYQPSAVAALSATSPTGFTVSGSFRQQLDWAVVEWCRDNVFEHPALRCLPDGDLSGLQLSWDEERQDCMAMDCTLWPTVDWPYLRIWATGTDGVEREYKVPLAANATPAAGSLAATPAQAVFELTGAVTANDYVELAWAAADGVDPSSQHATHMMYYNDTLEGVATLLANAISANTAATGMTASALGAQITLQYGAAAGANGNRVGVYGNVSGARTEIWQPASQTMSGGASPALWHVALNFSNLQGFVAPAFTTLVQVPTNSVRRMRWTWAPDQLPGNFVRTEFQVTVSNWTVAGTNLTYQVAGPGSWRAEDASNLVVYSGAWDAPAIGNYSGGSIRTTETPGSSVSCTYTAAGNHALYLGTRMFNSGLAAGAPISITIDGATSTANLAFAGEEDFLVRIMVAELAAGRHTVTAKQTGSGVFYFDFFEIAHPTANLPTIASTPDTTLATDWDTYHSICLAPERTAWLIDTLGFKGRANHYAGAMWFNELTCPGQQYASATVTLAGTPDFGLYTTVNIGGTLFKHMSFIADTAASVANALALAINAGATAVWANVAGLTLTIRSRAMGTAGNGMSVAADTGGSQNLTAAASGPLGGGVDGDLSTMAWAGGWRTDLTAAPRINRAARDWHSSYFAALKGYGIDVAAAFSMELQDGDPQPATGIAQRYPDGAAALLNTPSLQTNFSPASTAFWQQAYLDMANLMSAAGLVPYLQFGEVQWWYNASPAGMPFYDAYTQSAFQTAFGRPMGIIPSQNAQPADFPDECAFLPTLIGAFTNAIVAFVRAAHPNARFETLYPVDTNDTPLNKIVNYPTASWTAAALTCLKTENFTFTGDRDLDEVRGSIALPGQLGFPPAQSSHLVGISDYTTPWLKERGLALASGVESVVLFALDQFCLIGYPAPLNRSSRRSGKMG
jgi:hypothetical protein